MGKRGGIRFNSLEEPNLISYYKFQEGPGYILQDYVSGNHGNVVSGSTWVSNGIEFNGTTGYVQITSPNIGVSEQMTVVFWTIPTTQISGSYKFHKDMIRSGCYGGNGSWGVCTHQDFNTNNRVQIQCGWITGSDTWWMPTTAINQDLNNYIGVSWNRDTGIAKLYTDGIYREQRVLTTGIKPTTAKFRIGLDCSGAFKGTVCKFLKIYNTELTDDQHLKLYNDSK